MFRCTGFSPHLQKRLALAILAVWLRIRQVLELSIANLADLPALLLLGILEEFLILFEAATTGLWAVQVCPQAGNGIGCSEDKENLGKGQQ